MIDKFVWADVVDCYSLYSSELDSEEEVKMEFAQSHQLCLKLPTDKRPATPLEALDIIPDRLSLIKILLWIFATLPSCFNMHCREIVQRLEDRKELPA